MCDLIDLNSPNVKGLRDSKLASPLIPIPRDIEPDNNKSDKRANPLAIEKRESLGSNPFDTVLHETTEYISKKGDPFEIMLQRALKSKDRKEILRTQSVDFADDFTPRRRKKYLKAMNKTLDESLIAGGEDTIVIDTERRRPAIELAKGSIDLSVNNVFCDSKKNVTKDNNQPAFYEQSYKIHVMDADVLDSSILSQSMMNDTLLEIDSKISNSSKEFVIPATMSLKPPSSQRSLSQSDSQRSSKRLQAPCKRSQSIADTWRRTLQSDSNASSFLDRGFLQGESKQSEQSMFSNLSNVSSIVKLNSQSMMSNLSSLVSSNGTMNYAFLDNDISWKTSCEKIDTTGSSTETRLTQYDLSDLTEKLSRLKCAINRTDTPSAIKETNGSDSTKGENRKIANNKLIDVDVFVPEQSFDAERNKSAVSTSSSDSVFSDNSKVNKSILNEAKALARTFEELALRTDSDSSMDDLISNNTQWMSELLPAFEDEALIDNLIELPISPKGTEVAAKNNIKQSPININNADESSIKEVELQFTDCASAVNETTITTLLLDLKKLIKVENNSKASKLIDNLENVLGVKYKSNTELLATCFNMSNELHTPDLSNDKSNSGERSDKISIDRSQEESKKESTEEKVNSSKKSIQDTNNKLEDTSRATTTNSDNSVKISPCNNNNRNPLDTNSPEMTLNTNCNNKKANQQDEKLAIELLVNLEKLLRGQAEDVTTLQLLKNIGKALNIASNNFKIENESQPDDKVCDMQPIASVRTSESKRNTRRSLTKATHERSFESKSKLLEKTNRSISVIDSRAKSAANTQIHKHKDTFGSKDLKKRFSSEVRIFNGTANKKIPEMAKNGTTKFDDKKEKLLAIVDVKNKLKKRADVVNKRGPIKAVYPVGNMQKRVSLGKQTALSSQAITPPKSSKTISSSGKLISSTPNSMDNDYVPKKTVKSKPMASSTPDDQSNRTSNGQLISADNSKKRAFSCDISPVTTYVNGNDVRKDSPRRPTKLPTSKKCTPKRQPMDTSGIPKYLTPPRRQNRSLDMNQCQLITESPQYLNKSVTNYQRYSPIRPKRNAEKILQSPLKDSNKITAKVKPLKLISKMKQHSTSDFTEKENHYS